LFSGVTGHKSESACQIYVDNSDVSKRKAADAISIVQRDNTNSSVGCESSTGIKKPRSDGQFAKGGENIYNININVGANASCSGLSIFGSTM
jgi:hypothetical protein